MKSKAHKSAHKIKAHKIKAHKAKKVKAHASRTKKITTPHTSGGRGGASA